MGTGVLSTPSMGFRVFRAVEERSIVRKGALFHSHRPVRFGADISRPRA